MTTEVILKEFDKNKKSYDSFSNYVNSLINDLLSINGQDTHSISCRVKDRASLDKKIRKKEYRDITEITDLVGVRIITHYSDDVDSIAKIIEDSFKVDIENSIDKRKALDPDRFGYLSLHYIVSLPDERLKFPELSYAKEYKAEIQIRSILQHTWAEIEHDIGYKSNVEIPKSIRRKFSRLAGLLEIADSEFISIKKSLESYKSDVEKNIANSPEAIYIDKISYLQFVEHDILVKGISEEIGKITSIFIEGINTASSPQRIKSLEFFGIDTIFQLKNKLHEHKPEILRRAKDIEVTTPTMASIDLCVFYLTHVLASQLDDYEKILNFLDQAKISKGSKANEFAEYLIEFNSRKPVKNSFIDDTTPQDTSHRKLI